MTLEQYNEKLKADAAELPTYMIRNLLKQFESYNANTMDAYKDIIEYLENELINRQ